MRLSLVVIYLAMACWLLFASGARVALQLGSGADPDWLPFVGASLGVVALLLMGLAHDQWLHRKDRL